MELITGLCDTMKKPTSWVGCRCLQSGGSELLNDRLKGATLALSRFRPIRRFQPLFVG